MMSTGLSESGAAGLLATITGALVIANALNDVATYDRAARELARNPGMALSKRNPSTSKD
jgi:TetR/AcrR family transcriptional repressor of nem operon